MGNKPLTFAEFQQSTEYISLHAGNTNKSHERLAADMKLTKVYGEDELDNMVRAGFCGAFMYAGCSCHIESYSDYCDKFSTIIGPDEHTSDNLARLELILYHNKYLLEAAINA